MSIKNLKYDHLYMDIAIRVSEMSYAVRNKVGAVIVKDGNIISFGWNGTPSGFPNCCEYGDITKSEVIHAESNALIKLAKSTGNADGATLYLTLSPCYDCCKLIIQSGIKRVVYRDVYRVTEPIEFLKEAGILVEKIF